MHMPKSYRRLLALPVALGALALPIVVHAQKLNIVCTGKGGIQEGNCSVDDIVTTGAAFANMLVEISAALFFATFIYGGFMYLISGGRQDWVKKGTDAMSKSAIGMLIVLSAWTIVRYVVMGLTGASK